MHPATVTVAAAAIDSSSLRDNPAQGDAVRSAKLAAEWVAALEADGRLAYSDACARACRVHGVPPVDEVAAAIEADCRERAHAAAE